MPSNSFRASLVPRVSTEKSGYSHPIKIRFIVNSPYELVMVNIFNKNHIYITHICIYIYNYLSWFIQWMVHSPYYGFALVYSARFIWNFCKIVDCSYCSMGEVGDEYNPYAYISLVTVS